MTDIDDHSKRTNLTCPILPVVSSAHPCSIEKQFKVAPTCSFPQRRLPRSRRGITHYETRSSRRRDAQVRSIGYVASAVIASRPIELDAVVVTRDDGRFVLDVVPCRRARNVEEERLTSIALAELGLAPIVLTEREIRREPRYANARLVWSYRHIPVSVGLRMCILQLLLDDGPMPLGEVLKSVRSDRDPTPAVMALACADLLVLDLVSQPLGPATIARSRS